ncbi:ABC-F family ATP-binding cassette domain-containing protein [Parvibacter caecicola]|uniref:ATPase subunit of ABC transporter with duplicated ATPase domains n=1 Tax=Parvibacter caecicola TaxID=747645 RepID=A0A7W5D2C0_9ACTN|nr:ABC-F family ATP-binding cassette domain-containing protein [Parvibacter caecicola]MBB3171372.1 ATPase subunit of ABC transporter with duplicated ATPase domains [Parvibacter caecicola]MCR2041249.1 ABC-F family ATP-binding cassette domain-containing protein [Parvibacter caecicola]RNL11568.1 ABC transporter ATP-binding protein [Parvibacter caecicola]
MAFLLGCEKAAVEFPTKTVFSGISLGVDEGDRIGIVGRNGDGKSTLLRLLAGLVQPDEGRVLTTRDTRVGILGQADALDAAATVKQAILGDMPDYAWAKDNRIKGILAGLVADIPGNRLVGTLSGGQRRRVDLARLLVGEWDVLMLDEPTNHLDIRAITWLAGYLKTIWRKGQGALLVVTHDRWFLDEVCLSMWEVHHGKVEPFEGGFSAYIMQRVERERLANLAEQKRQNQLRRELAWLSRGARARATKPKFHVAAAQALIADVPPLRDELALKRMAMARLGKDVVELKGVTEAFDGHKVLDDVSWIIGPGDRYGIVGGNGVGKTTLLRVIQGALAPTAGRVKIGKTVRFAVLSQHLDELTALGDDRVRQVISRYSRRTMLDGKEMTPAQVLEKLGFTKVDLNEPVCDLSGGQKRRLALMLILLDEPNVLILDEPGNDLDTDMLAAVEDVLDGWPGTLLLVTHDRYLMERVTDHQFAIVDGKVRHLPRGVEEYLELAAAREVAGAVPPGFTDAEERAAGAVADEAAALTATAGAVPAAPKLSGGEQRQLRKLMASNEKKADTLRGRIAAKQEEMAAADPSDYLALGKIQEEITQMEDQIEELELEWLEAAEKLGE